MDNKLALSVSEAADILSISRPTVYELMRRKDFPAFKLGKRTLISRAGLEAWIEAQVEQSKEARQ